MNEQQLMPGQNRTERLLGIFNIRKSGDHLEALFKWEIITTRNVMGGGLIVDAKDEKEEWREVTGFGCFPTLKQQYRVS